MSVIAGCGKISKLKCEAMSTCSMRSGDLIMLIRGWNCCFSIQWYRVCPSCEQDSRFYLWVTAWPLTYCHKPVSGVTPGGGGGGIHCGSLTCFIWMCDWYYQLDSHWVAILRPLSSSTKTVFSVFSTCSLRNNMNKATSQLTWLTPVYHVYNSITGVLKVPLHWWLTPRCSKRYMTITEIRLFIAVFMLINVCIIGVCNYLPYVPCVQFLR